jgi:hypothetical protein
MVTFTSLCCLIFVGAYKQIWKEYVQNLGDEIYIYVYKEVQHEGTWSEFYFSIWYFASIVSVEELFILQAVSELVPSEK